MQVQIKSILDRTKTELKICAIVFITEILKSGKKTILKLHPVISIDYISTMYHFFSAFLLVCGVIIKNVGPRYKFNRKMEKQDRSTEKLQLAELFSKKKHG